VRNVPPTSEPGGLIKTWSFYCSFSAFGTSTLVAVYLSNSSFLSLTVLAHTLIAIVAALPTLIRSISAFCSSEAMPRRSGDCMRCLVIFAVVSALVVCGPALYWKFNKGFVGSTRANSLCPPCVCDCPPPLSLLQIAPGMLYLYSDLDLTCSSFYD